MYIAVWKVAMTMGPCQGVLSPLAGLGCPLSYTVVQTEFPTHHLLFYKWVLVNEDDQQSFQVCLSLSLSHCLYFRHTQRVCHFAKANPPPPLMDLVPSLLISPRPVLPKKIDIFICYFTFYQRYSHTDPSLHDLIS